MAKPLSENNWGLRVKPLRMRAGFASQAAFAEACDIDRHTMSKIESGAYSQFPTAGMVQKLAKVLKIPVTDLLPALVDGTPVSNPLPPNPLDAIVNLATQLKGTALSDVHPVAVKHLDSLIGKGDEIVATVYVAAPEDVSPECLAGFVSDGALEELPEKSMVICDTAAYRNVPPGHNDVVVFVAGKTASFARIKRLGDVVTLVNTQGKWALSAVQIKGRALWEQRKL